MPITKHTYKEAFAQISEHKEKDSDLSSILECYEDIFKAQNEVKESFTPDFTGLDLSYCQKCTSNHLPFLNSKNVNIEWNLFNDLSKQIYEVAKNIIPSEESDTKDSWVINDESRQSLLKGCFEDTALLKKIAKQNSTDYDMFTFIICQSLTPFIEKYAEKLREYIDSSVWLKGSCPVCGGEPLMGRLEEEIGKKHLQCYLCRTNWEFARLECYSCENTEQEKQQYFFDEEDNVHRVEVCDNCKTYLKVVDMRNAESDVVVVVENLLTLHLDFVAKREGFKRDTVKLFGLKI